LGGLLAKLLRQGDDVIEAATVGPGAAHQLVKAVVRANRYLQEDGPQADGLPLCAGFQVQSVQLPNERDAAAASGSAATPDAPAGGGDGADAAAAAAADGAATSSSSPGRGGKASGLRFFVRRLPAEAAAAWAQAPGEQLYVRVVASGDKRPNPGGLARALVASEEAARAAGGTAKRTVMTAVGTKSELVALRGLSVARQLLVRAEQDVIAVPRYAAVDKLRLPDGTPLNGLELCLLPVPPRPTSVRAMQSRQAGGPARGAKAAGDSSAATVAQLQEQISTLAKNQAQLIGMLKEQQLAAQQAAGGGDSA
jgi:stage V sporulation protein SpoVS